MIDDDYLLRLAKQNLSHQYRFEVCRLSESSGDGLAAAQAAELCVPAFQSRGGHEVLFSLRALNERSLDEESRAYIDQVTPAGKIIKKVYLICSEIVIFPLVRV